MMAQPVALYLTHFDAAPAKALPSLDFGTGTDLMPAWSPEREQEEIEARIAAAREAGYAEGVEAAQAEAAAEREQAREAFDGELAAERQRWVAQEAESLTEKLAAALQQMQETSGRMCRPGLAALRDRRSAPANDRGAGRPCWQRRGQSR